MNMTIALSAGEQDTFSELQLGCVNKMRVQPNHTFARSDDKRSALKNATASPLLRSPPEIRNKIYDYLYSTSAIRFVCYTSDPPMIYLRPGDDVDPDFRRRRQGSKTFHGLLLAYRQLCVETWLLPSTMGELVFFSGCDEYLDSPDFNLKTVHNELIRMVKNIRYISEPIECSLPCEECEDTIETGLHAIFSSVG